MTGMGHNTYVGLGEEVAWGTPVARTKFLDVNSVGIQPAIELIESAGLKSPGIQVAKVKMGTKAYAGDLAVEATYTNLGILLKHALGNVASGLLEAAVSWTHTFTIADDLPIGLTTEVFRDTTDFAGAEANKALLYEGGRIRTLSLEAAVGQYLMATVGMVFQNEVRAAKTATPTLDAGNLIVLTDASVISYNAVTLATVSAFSMQLDNALEDGKRAFNSTDILQPRRNAKVALTGSLTLDFDDFTMYDDFRAATSRQIILTFTGPALGANFWKLTVTIPNVMITDYGMGVDGPGELTSDVSFKAFRTGETGSEVTMALVTNNTSPIV